MCIGSRRRQVVLLETDDFSHSTALAASTEPLPRGTVLFLQYERASILVFHVQPVCGSITQYTGRNHACRATQAQLISVRLISNYGPTTAPRRDCALARSERSCSRHTLLSHSLIPCRRSACSSILRHVQDIRPQSSFFGVLDEKHELQAFFGGFMLTCCLVPCSLAQCLNVVAGGVRVFDRRVPPNNPASVL